jgi:hypothetical protein
MVDVVSIIVAVIAGVLALISTGVQTFYTWFSDERRRLSEAETLVAKYRDPLLLASDDLQSRLYGITDLYTTNFLHGSSEQKEYLLFYTAFLVGQYLSWAYILRRKAQFLQLSTDRQNKKLTTTLSAIQHGLSTDKHNDKGGGPLMLYKGPQMAIGELMTVKEDQELYCIGYAAFSKRCAGIGEATRKIRVPPTDGVDGDDEHGDISTVREAKESQRNTVDVSRQEFQSWFRSIIRDVRHISEAKTQGRDRIPDQRLRRLQHLLLDLIHVLDEKSMRSEAKYTKRCHRAAICECSQCKGNSACPCTGKEKAKCPWNVQARAPAVSQTDF